MEPALGSPAGLEAAAESRTPAGLNDPDPARFGPFAFQFQVAAETREFEYPWAYFVFGIEPGMTRISAFSRGTPVEMST